MNTFDFRSEALKCENFFQDLNKNWKGLTGLLNLSNSCYMNSALQCLSNTAELRNYFLKRLYHADIQQENPYGTKGDSAYAFAILIRRVWLEKASFISPNFMKILFQKHPQLSMYAKDEQHDSQEFLHTFLDVLNEDLKKNRGENVINVIKNNDICVEKAIKNDEISLKNYDTDISEKAGKNDDFSENTIKNDEKIGSWTSLLGKNSSILMDLFFGVLKSTLRCPECDFTSNHFEPFLNLSLHFPIMNPPKNLNNLLYFTDSIEEDCKLVGFDSNFLEFFPMNFKEKIKILENIENKHLSFVMIYRHAAALLYENEAKNMKEILEQNKGGFLGIIENNEKIKQDEGLFSLAFSKNERNTAFSQLDCFKLIKINRKSGSASLTQILHMFLQKFLVKLGFSHNNTKKYSLRLRLLDMRNFLSICEKCHETEFCRCSFEFVMLGSIENKYRHSEYLLYFEVCFDWEQLSALEKGKIVDYAENFQNLLKNLTNTPKKSLNKTNEGVSIYDFLKHFRNPETLCSQNAWFCNKCKKNQRATTQMELFSAPKILILHLKRFKNNRNIKTKINFKINYPLENLDLTDYVLEPSFPEELIEKDTKKLGGNTIKKQVSYDLYGVINHHGSSLTCGHYTAFCKNAMDSRWYKFDDKCVYEISENAVCSNDAYVLFYRRRING